MKIEELKTKTKDQLLQMLLDYKKELMNLRFQVASRKITNTSRIRYVRKTIAKIKTLVNNTVFA